MEVTRQRVLEEVKNQQPTTPTEVADRICKKEGKPSELSSRYQDVLDQVKTHMVQLEDLNEIQTNLNWEYTLQKSQENSLKSKISNIFS